MMTAIAGGCLCGAVRYSISGNPVSVVYCHCLKCRRAAGAVAVAWATFSATALQVVSGTAACYRSSSHAERLFCSRCGTQLFFRFNPSSPQIDVAIGSVDDPVALRPTCHLWTASMIPWLDSMCDLPRHSDDGPD